jgi:CRP-like cAMP-binding protein
MDEDTGKSETVCMLGRNDVFGEIGIVNGCRRNASIITRYPVEMLVFSDEVSS